MSKKQDSPNKEKTVWQPTTILAPVPAVMVTCQGKQGRPNIITIAWVGTVCSEPPMLSISVRPERYSYALIKETGEFAVNLTDRQTVKASDLCGVISGRDRDKFHETGLTIGRSQTIQPPIIVECPINIECKVEQEISLGSHNMFIARVTAVQVTQKLIDDKDCLHIENAGLIGFAHGHYYQLGRQIGQFGFSVKKT
ncbi:MAG: flavin reductase family protein [Candidatus Riflebacteria bacterium HGW-Riflebacteria-2]|jgi:flavin reductase (DIM6/NTAB) family NADH-FMN oxidoreductase RutF|nr:MAG: flavin reductase family protein [Candidatus Riflebacteria bacterium HGW-Riflebacteria-2]